MNFKKWVKSIQTAAYNGARTVYYGCLQQVFNFDGQSSGSNFYAGASDRPSNNGYQVSNEKGSMEVLQRYTGQNLVLSLPSGKTLR